MIIKILPRTYEKPTSGNKIWDWSEEKIKKNRKFFTADLSQTEDVHELIME